MKKIILPIILVVVGLIIGYFVFSGTQNTGSTVLGGSSHFSGITVQEDGLTLEDGGDVTLGSGSNVTQTDDQITVGGIETYYVQDTTMEAATTTPCALAAPGDSLLLSATVDFTVSTTTGTTISIAKASTPYATTTILGSAVTLDANETETFVATTTSSQVWHLGEYLVVGMSKTTGSGQNGTMGVYSPTGTCNAVWQSVD